MIIYFVRHGESEGNKENTHQHTNTSLSDKGINQAKSLAKRLKDIHFDIIYSSDSLRAKQTAEIINKETKTNIEYWTDLVEMRMPSEIRGKKVDDPEIVKIKKLIHENYYKGNFKYSDEETFDELNARAKRVLKHLEDKHENQTILIISHSTAIKAMVGRIVFEDELTPKVLLRMRFHMWANNTGVTVCEKHPKYSWQLDTWNDMTHL
jgi:broad specificity phosphatase PhoE